MSNQLLGIIYGLASAAIWGSGDFSGGFATKKDNVFTVVFLSQFFGLLLLILLAVLFADPTPTTRDLFFGALAGLGGMVGLLGFYYGLSQQQMGLFAPLVAVITAILPVFAGILFEGLPSMVQIIGFCIAFTAVWFLSLGGEKNQITPKVIWLAITAGLGFSTFFIAIDQADGSGAVFWPLVAARTASVVVLSVILAVRRLPHTAPRQNLPVIGLTGIFDSGGNIFFVLAAQVGRLDIASVLGSLYPATTVMLAWLILKERLQRMQWIGVGLTLVALLLIAGS